MSVDNNVTYMDGVRSAQTVTPKSTAGHNRRETRTINKDVNIYADIRGDSQDLSKFPYIYVCLRPYIIQVWYAVLVFKFTSLVYDS